MIIKSIPYVVTSGIDVGKRRVRWQIQCNICSKKYIKRPSQVERRRNPHYCSKECHFKSGTTKAITCTMDGCMKHVSMRSWNKKHCRDCNKRNLRRIDYKEKRNQIHDLLGGECVVCGEDDPIYFQLDHIRNDADHYITSDRQVRRRYPIKPAHVFKEIKRFQLMCANCNHAKRMNGGKIYKPKKKRKVA